MSSLDKMLYALFILAAVALAALNFCAADWLWGVVTVAVILAWAYLLHRRCHKAAAENRSQTFENANE